MAPIRWARPSAGNARMSNIASTADDTPDLTDAIGLTQALVRVPSVTPDAGAVLDLLEGWLATLGFETSRLVFQAPDTPDVDNLFAIIGDGGPHFCFAGHVDVVPTGAAEAWTDPPFSGVVREGYLYGRGATDMKSGVGAFVAALAQFLAPEGDGEGGLAEGGQISLVITGDEEGPAINGTDKVLAWMRENGTRPDHALVGEPSGKAVLGDQIRVGRRGSVSGTLRVSGVQGHVAYPELAENPVPALSRALSAISGPLDEGNNAFPPSNLEVTGLDCPGLADNVIPGAAAARFNIRFNTRHDPESLKALLAGRIAAATGEGAVWTLDLDARHNAPFLTEDHAFVGLISEVVEAETGQRPQLSTSGGTSDARFFKGFCPVVELGLPGLTLHAVDERVALADVTGLQALYLRLLERYFR